MTASSYYNCSGIMVSFHHYYTEVQRDSQCFTSIVHESIVNHLNKVASFFSQKYCQILILNRLNLQTFSMGACLQTPLDRACILCMLSTIASCINLSLLSQSTTMLAPPPPF